MAKQTVPLYTVSSGDRVHRAREALAGALPDASIGEGEEGAFEVSLTAGSADEAEEKVREALAASGTGDDFVLRGSITGREMPADDPRQPDGASDEDAAPAPSPDERAGRVADAASRVADAARGAAADPEGKVADATQKLADEAPERVGSATRRMAASAPGPVEEAAAKLAEEAPRRVADATQRLAEEAPGMAGAAAERASGMDWKRMAAPLGAGFVALLVIARLRRR